MISEIKPFIRNRFPFILPAIRPCVNIARRQLAQRHIKRMLKERSELFVELGGGIKKGEGGWVTIDMTDRCDIFWDLRNGLPFPDERITRIYSSHFFEHLSFKESQKLLDECRRVLVSGGTFSICVPNARLFIEAYWKRDFLDNPFFSYKPACNNTTIIDYVNYVWTVTTSICLTRKTSPTF